MADHEIKQLLRMLPQEELIEGFLLPMMKDNKGQMDKLRAFLLQRKNLANRRASPSLSTRSSLDRQREGYAFMGLRQKEGKERPALPTSSRRRRRREERILLQQQQNQKPVEPILWFAECPTKIKTLILSFVDPVENEGNIFMVCKEWNELWNQSEIWEMAYLHRWLDFKASPTGAPSTFSSFFSTSSEEDTTITLSKKTPKKRRGAKGKEKVAAPPQCDFKALFIERHRVEKMWEIEETKHQELAELYVPLSAAKEMLNSIIHMGWVERLWQAIMSNNTLLVAALIYELQLSGVSPAAVISRTHIRRAIQNNNTDVVSMLLSETKMLNNSTAVTSTTVTAPASAGRGRKRKPTTPAAGKAAIKKEQTVKKETTEDMWAGYTTPLEHAVISGDTDMVAAVLRAGGGSKERGSGKVAIQGSNAYKLAELKGDEKVMELLLSGGSNYEAEGRSTPKKKRGGAVATTTATKRKSTTKQPTEAAPPKTPPAKKKKVAPPPKDVLTSEQEEVKESEQVQEEVETGGEKENEPQVKMITEEEGERNNEEVRQEEIPRGHQMVVEQDAEQQRQQQAGCPPPYYSQQPIPLPLPQILSPQQAIPIHHVHNQHTQKGRETNFGGGNNNGGGLGRTPMREWIIENPQDNVEQKRKREDAKSGSKKGSEANEATSTKRRRQTQPTQEPQQQPIQQQQQQAEFAMQPQYYPHPPAHHHQQQQQQQQHAPSYDATTTVVVQDVPSGFPGEDPRASLPLGWRMEMNVRNLGNGSTTTDISYVSAEGIRCWSLNEVQRVQERLNLNNAATTNDLSTTETLPLLDQPLHDGRELTQYNPTQPLQQQQPQQQQPQYVHAGRDVYQGHAYPPTDYGATRSLLQEPPPFQTYVQPPQHQQQQVAEPQPTQQPQQHQQQHQHQPQPQHQQQPVVLQSDFIPQLPSLQPKVPLKQSMKAQRRQAAQQQGTTTPASPKKASPGRKPSQQPTPDPEQQVLQPATTTKRGAATTHTAAKADQAKPKAKPKAVALGARKKVTEEQPQPQEVVGDKEVEEEDKEEEDKEEEEDEKSVDEWTCEKCTYVNGEREIRCTMCRTVKRRAATSVEKDKEKKEEVEKEREKEKGVAEDKKPRETLAPRRRRGRNSSNGVSNNHNNNHNESTTGGEPASSADSSPVKQTDSYLANLATVSPNIGSAQQE